MIDAKNRVICSLSFNVAMNFSEALVFDRLVFVVSNGLFLPQGLHTPFYITVLPFLLLEYCRWSPLPGVGPNKYLVETPTSSKPLSLYIHFVVATLCNQTLELPNPLFRLAELLGFRIYLRLIHKYPRPLSYIQQIGPTPDTTATRWS